jgi:arylsulfatase A-like enzyme
MSTEPGQLGEIRPLNRHLRAVYGALAPRAPTAIIFGALLCNLSVKLFHALRSGLILEYPAWILTDLAMLLTIEVVLSLIYSRWPTRRVFRGITIFAVVVCTWSVVNAGWMIRTGTQILPMELLPLIRDPINIFKMVAGNLSSMPGVAAVLLIPSAIALIFFFSVLARPRLPALDRRRLRTRIFISLAVSVIAVVGSLCIPSLVRLQARGMQSNCQSRAILAFLLPRYRHLARNDFENATRVLPRCDAVSVKLKPGWVNHNVVIVVLEGIQYDCTSLALEQGGIAPVAGLNTGGLTPNLAAIAHQGVSFTNARAVVTHTTKALFGLLTGRAPSASQDIGEAVPVDPPYASLATILKKGLGFRTAFFQSPTGTFEGRPGLVHNLGFDKFWSRENLNDPSRFVGYLGSDEFAMLKPISDWITSEDKPFLLTIMCSVTHDNYEVPQWFGAKAGDPAACYQQTISYTDQFIAALDAQLASLHLTEDTIFVVVGDHGEGFDEHCVKGHERLGYEEVLRVAMCMRAPYLIEPGTRVAAPVNSMDLTPTILSLLGFDIGPMHFDGINALGPVPQDRRVYFACWMQQGPTGFIQQNNKFVYDPERNVASLYRLNADPLELSGIELPKEQSQRLMQEIIQWRRGTIFRIDQEETGATTLFGSWHAKWNRNRRDCAVKYIDD